MILSAICSHQTPFEGSDIHSLNRMEKYQFLHQKVFENFAYRSLLYQLLIALILLPPKIL